MPAASSSPGPIGSGRTASGRSSRPCRCLEPACARRCRRFQAGKAGEPLYEGEDVARVHPKALPPDVHLDEGPKRRIGQAQKAFRRGAVVEGGRQVIVENRPNRLGGGKVAPVKEEWKTNPMLSDPNSVGQVDGSEGIGPRGGDNPGRLDHPETAGVALEGREHLDVGTRQAAKSPYVVRHGGAVHLHPIGPCMELSLRGVRGRARRPWLGCPLIHRSHRATMQLGEYPSG